MSGISIWTYLYGANAEAASADMKAFQAVADGVAAGFAPPDAG